MSNQTMTPEEARAEFFDTVAVMFRYWRDVPKPMIVDGQSEAAARMEGFLFSLLNIFDGTNLTLPAFDIVPAPHPEDEPKWPQEPINDCAMHEIFPWEKVRS